MQYLIAFVPFLLFLTNVNTIDSLVYVEPNTFQHVIKYRLQTQHSQLKLIKLNLGLTHQKNELVAYALTANNQWNTQQDIKHQTATIFTSLIHPRELITHIAMATFLSDMIERYNTDIELQLVLNRTIVIAFPFVNIDGYLYLKTVSNEQKKKIRKNRNTQETKCISQHEKGIDINRNFDIKFGTVPQSSVTCGEQYHGKAPFSEPQAKAIKQLFQNFHITIALDLHSYGNQFIYPFAYDKTGRIIEQNSIYTNYQFINQKLINNKYKVLSCWKSLSYIADGVYIDWALASGALSFAYQFGQSFQLRGQKEDKKDVLFAFEGFYEVLKLNGFAVQIYKKGTDLIQIQSYSFIDLSVNIQFGQYSQTIKLESSKRVQLNIKNKQLQTDTIKINVVNSSIIKTFDLRNIQYKNDETWVFGLVLFILILAVVGVILCITMTCINHYNKKVNEKVLGQEYVFQFTQTNKDNFQEKSDSQ